jgi:hypothetical protein
MIRTLCGLAWALSVEVACAQQADAELNDTQRLGRELFNQSCRESPNRANGLHDGGISNACTEST